VEESREAVSTSAAEKTYFEETKTELSEEERKRLDLSLLTTTEIPILLIVEDNADVRNYIKQYLNKDFGILEAVDGEDGWNKSIEHIPDLIISDVMMPKMDGFKLCEKIKTDEKTSHIPVILLTAKASGGDKIEGLETGADDYIMKPFEPEELKARIKNLIEQRKRIHEHFKKQGIFELEQSKITSVDKKFLQKAFEIINHKISDTSFSVEVFAEQLTVSKSLLHKKIVSLTGEPPGELIRRIRLKKAADLIEQKFGNISEIALEVGFNNPAYFSECFKKQFGVSPSQYQQKSANI
jgi:DNA-binding response OmpR family regulator